MKKSIKILIFAAIAFSFAACNKERIDNPQAGDVYQIERPDIDGHAMTYQLLKVKSVGENDLVVMPNRLYYHEKVYCIVAGDYFNSKAAFTISKSELKKMYDEDKIVDIIRYYEDSCLGNDK
ncbi:MAG: hypothetical protein LBR81_07290 [Prevotellaceae bacterium]|jgi:hypothetical protein|nr:hypothetical protein [Prevotellaceae bacterium]